jgi:hypothetical protein
LRHDRAREHSAVVTHTEDMTAAQFRRIALDFPGAVEGSHMGHADFRVGKRIFATLGHPDDRFAVAMLTPADQDLIVRDHPECFAPVAGAWGASGSTTVTLARARVRATTAALEAAWRRRAPKQTLAEFDRRSARGPR